MFVDGLLIMLIGMITVFMFLSLLSGLLSLFPKFFRKYLIQLEIPKKEDSSIPAVISAAVYNYYKKNK